MTVDAQRLKSTFFDLVQIDSPTFNEKAIIDYLASQLSELGFAVRTDGAGDKIGGQTGNLIAALGGDREKPPIFFCCHVDTVEPGNGVRPREMSGVIASAGETVLGADDKAGVSALLEMARVVTESLPGACPVELIFTVAEEKGLLGAKHLDWELVRARHGFVFDAAGPVGVITVAAPWQDTFEAVFHGKAAHAGVHPEQGVSAVRAAATAIESMRLGRIDGETTANIGIIEGGRAINIVPEKATIKGEARSLTEAKLIDQTGLMMEAAKSAARLRGANVDVEVKREYDGFRLSKSDQVVSWAMAAMESIGIAPALVSTGGGSDTNVFNARGVPTVNLGVGYEAPHTIDESISVAELERAANLAVAVVKTVSGLNGHDPH